MATVEEAEDGLPENSLLLEEPEQGVDTDVEGLAEDLLMVFNSSEFSDVEFVCKDGVRVHACRLILVARSKVLRSMLMNGMAETMLSEIPLPDISSSALLPTLEFLYTGGVKQNALTMSSAFEVLHVGDFLLLPKLQRHVLMFLEPALKKVKDAGMLARCFSQLVEISAMAIGVQDKDLKENDLIVRRLVSHMAWTLRAISWKAADLSALSLKAFNVFLNWTESTNRCTISFEEYLRARNLLLWSSSKVSLEAAESLEPYLPDEELLRSQLKPLKKAVKFSPKADVVPVEPGLGVQVEDWVKQLDKSWSVVNFQLVHPQILGKVLEPLDIIPFSVLASAFRHQALQAGDMNVMKWDEHYKCPSLDISEDGFVLGRGDYTDSLLATRSEFTLSTMPINRSSGTCEWDILIEEPCKDLVIGFYAYVPVKRLDPSQCWGFDCTAGKLCNGSILYDARYGKKCGDRKGSRVRIHVDMTAKTCAFTIDGEKFGVTWSKLPHELYPAVAMSRGRVRIQLVSDADFM